MDLHKIVKETRDIIRKGYYKYDTKKIDLSLNTGVYDYELVDVYSPTRLMDILCDSDHYMKEIFYEPYNHHINVCLGASFEIAKNYFRPLIMNLANALCPGGGSTIDRNTLETKLCYSTSLYQSLSSQKASQVYLYNENLSSPMYSDYMLLSTNVAVFRDENHDLIEYPYPVSVFSMMPANCFKMPNGESKDSEIDAVMKMRLRLFFHTAARNMYRNLIISPVGFEEYGYLPYKIAQYFQEILIEEEYIDFFEHIVFVFDREFSNITLPVFKKYFENIYYENRVQQLGTSIQSISEPKRLETKQLLKIEKKLETKQPIESKLSLEIHKQSIEAKQPIESKQFAIYKRKYIQAMYPFPECNYSLKNNNSTMFSGFAQGILEDGIPFVAELLQTNDMKATAVFVLPYIENMNEMIQITNNNDCTKMLKKNYRKITLDSWNSNLCQGMQHYEGKIEDNVIDSYINYLIYMNLIDLQKSDIEGFVHVLYDIAGHKVVAIEITLKHYDHVDVLVPLRFQPLTKELIIEDSVTSRSRIT